LKTCRHDLLEQTLNEFAGRVGRPVLG